MDRPKVFGNFINGAWAEGAGEYANTNPSDTRDVIGKYARATEKQAKDAIGAAHAAFPAWSLSTPQQRFDVLDAVGTEILARKAELGDLLAREEGKTLAEAVGEVVRAGYIFKFFGGEALRIPGEIVQSVRPGVGVEITREPLGVVSIVTPWNFPIAIPAWKIAPALCYGNTVVFKPAELVPGSAWALTEIISRAAFPAGVFNLVMGKSSEIGDTLLNDPRIAGISFTGSQAVGRKVAQAAVAGLKKFQLEMGGKNPLVVLDDANLEVAVNCAVQGGFFSTGQRCTASSKVIATPGIHDRFVGAVDESLPLCPRTAGPHNSLPILWVKRGFSWHIPLCGGPQKSYSIGRKRLVSWQLRRCPCPLLRKVFKSSRISRNWNSCLSCASRRAGWKSASGT